MLRRALLLSLALAAAALSACTDPLQQQHVDPCDAPCAPGAESFGDPCPMDGGGPEGVCSADGACLAPCRVEADCPNSGAGGPCVVAVCDRVVAACSYRVADDGAACGVGGTCAAGVCGP